MIPRLRLAFRLFWCALFHQRLEWKGWYRCATCRPIRRRRPNRKLAEQIAADMQEALGELKP